MNNRFAVFPGTFDPITLGHLDIIRRSSLLFENLTVLVAENISKNKMFECSQRIRFIEEAVSDFDNVTVSAWNGLTSDYCIENNIGVIVRGIRTTADFQYEYDMSVFNRQLHSEIETIFIPCSQQYSSLSSSAVRQLFVFGKNVDFLVPESVSLYLKTKTID